MSLTRREFGKLALAGLLEAPFAAGRGALLPDVLIGERYPVGYALSQIVAQAAQVGLERIINGNDLDSINYLLKGTYASHSVCRIIGIA